jgi:DnaJ homolog subfamily C member 8
MSKATEEDKIKEIERLLESKDAFNTLRLDIVSCEVGDVHKSFRKIVLLVHPDKCSLENAATAFDKAKQAHALLSDELILNKFKAAHFKKCEKEKEQGGTSGIGSRFTSAKPGVASGKHEKDLTAEERAKEAQERERNERYLAAKREEDERTQKRARKEEQLRADKNMDEALKPEINDWRNFQKFLRRK